LDWVVYILQGFIYPLLWYMLRRLDAQRRELSGIKSELAEVKGVLKAYGLPVNCEPRKV